MKALFALLVFAVAMAAQTKNLATKSADADVVRYRLEYREGIDGVLIHFSELLSPEMVSSLGCAYGRGDAPGCVLYKQLMAVRGVQGISIDRYQIELKSGMMFTPREVIDGVVKAVREYLHAKEMRAEPAIVPESNQDQQGGCQLRARNTTPFLTQGAKATWVFLLFVQASFRVV